MFSVLVNGEEIEILWGRTICGFAFNAWVVCSGGFFDSMLYIGIGFLPKIVAVVLV